MKITTDVNPAAVRGGGNVLPRSSADIRSINVSDAKLAQDFTAKMQRDKSMIDALAIAQSSRDLVQKALNVSSRLMSLASEAMVTGQVNIGELAGQVSSLNGSMGNYGERVSVPVERNSIPVDDVQVKMRESFEQLNYKAAEMMSGRVVDRKEFEPIQTNLKSAASGIDARINTLSAELGVPKGIETSNVDYSRLNRNTTGLVVNNPAAALRVQGNISYDMAGKLTMS